MRDDETTFLYELARDSEELKLLEYVTESEKPIVRYRAAELIGGLTSGSNPDVRERVADVLRRTAKRDEHDAVRAAAIDALYLRDEDALEELIDEAAAGGLDEPPAWMRIDRLTDWLEADHAEFRLVAAAALGQIGDERATPALVDVVTDPDVRVRTRAVSACGSIADPRAIGALAGRLDDTHDQVRREAATALATIGTADAVAALRPAVHSDTESVRVIAVDALATSGSLEVLPLLAAGLNDSSELVRRTATRSVLSLLASAPPERSHAIRNRISEAVLEASPPDLERQLLTILGGNQPAHVRRNATWLLGQIVDGDSDRLEDVQRRLIATLDDPDELTAKVATSALVELEGETLTAQLREAIDGRTLSGPAESRAKFVLEKLRRSRSASREAVTNSIEFTYVEEPTDYPVTSDDRSVEEQTEFDGLGSDPA